MMKKKIKPSRLFMLGARSYDGKAVTIKTETSVLGVLKVVLTLFLILCQIALIIYLNTSYAFAVSWFMIVCFAISGFTCIHVLSSNKNGLSKAVWIIFLLVCVTFGYLFYWISDERILFSGTKKRYRAVYERFNDEQAQKSIETFSEAVKQNSEYLYSTGKFKTYAQTDAKYFSSGTLLFDDVIERIKQARKFVFMEFFIISDGVLLNRVFDVLKEKVKDGVEVRVIFDDLGSKRTLSTKTKIKLKNAGIKLKSFNKLIPVFSVALNYRDHRKIIVVDGQTAYTGGSNLADEYINEKRMHGYWKDTGVRLDGNAVDAFTLMFLRQWEVLTKLREDYSKFLNLYVPTKNKSAFIPYADGLDYVHPIGRGVYENMISSANKFLYIMTPYFIVDDGITNLLINKALSGVDVRIILPGIPDKAFVYSVSRSNCEKLMDYGVKIFIMKNAFVHSKLLLTEDAVAIGSVNMDLRSFYQQFECSLYTDDTKVMDGVKKDFDNTFKASEQITQKNKWSKNIFYRLFVGAIQVFAPFM